MGCRGDRPDHAWHEGLQLDSRVARDPPELPDHLVHGLQRWRDRARCERSRRRRLLLEAGRALSRRGKDPRSVGSESLMTGLQVGPPLLAAIAITGGVGWLGFFAALIIGAVRRRRALDRIAESEARLRNLAAASLQGIL